MTRRLNLQIAIVVAVALGVFAVQQAQPQVTTGAATNGEAAAGNGAAKAAGARKGKSTPGSSAWTAGASSFGPSAETGWGGGKGFVTTDTTPMSAKSEIFGQSPQPGGVWRSRQSFSAIQELATPTRSVGVESVSGEAAPRFHLSAGHASKLTANRLPSSSMGAHQFGVPMRGRATTKASFGKSRLGRSTTASHIGGIRSKRGSPSDSASAGRQTTGLDSIRRSQSVHLGQTKLGNGSTGGANPWKPQISSGLSTPQ